MDPESVQKWTYSSEDQPLVMSQRELPRHLQLRVPSKNFDLIPHPNLQKAQQASVLAES